MFLFIWLLVCIADALLYKHVVDKVGVRSNTLPLSGFYEFYKYKKG